MTQENVLPFKLVVTKDTLTPFSGSTLRHSRESGNPHWIPGVPGMTGKWVPRSRAALTARNLNQPLRFRFQCSTGLFLSHPSRNSGLCDRWFCTGLAVTLIEWIVLGVIMVIPWKCKRLGARCKLAAQKDLEECLMRDRVQPADRLQAGEPQSLAPGGLPGAVPTGASSWMETKLPPGNQAAAPMWR